MVGIEQVIMTTPIKLQIGQKWKSVNGDFLILTDHHLFWVYKFKYSYSDKWVIFKDTDIGIKLWIRETEAVLNNSVNKIWLDLNEEINAKS